MEAEVATIAACSSSTSTITNASRPSTPTPAPGWINSNLSVATASASLDALQPVIAQAVQTAAALGDEDIGSAAVGFTLACMRHETQYSRLYRS
jgi:hypothetical protein